MLYKGNAIKKTDYYLIGFSIISFSIFVYTFYEYIRLI